MNFHHVWKQDPDVPAQVATEMQGGGERSRVQVAASGLAPIQRAC